MAKTIITVVLIKSLFISLSVCMSKPNNPSFTQQTNADNTTGFSIDLMHRDSLQSPYYDPSLSPTQTVVNALRRSLDRFRWLNQSLYTGSTETDIELSIHSGDYLMRYKIGQQEVPSLGVLDTGSGLIWTQGFPCSNCIKQNPPLYIPKMSSTYKMILCNEFECNRSRYAFCDNTNTNCLYSLSYEDQTFTRGRLSEDTFILASAGGTTTYLSNIVFGCATRAKSKFYGYESGVIGLGRGPDSLVSQLGASAKGKFSYCLVSKLEQSKGSNSRLNFGDNALVLGESVVDVPLVLNPNYPTFYYVTLLGFDIGYTRYMFSPNDGNFIVDSGWLETRLPNDMYKSLKSNMIRALPNLKTIEDPTRMLDLCFATTRDNLWLPTVTLHFRGGDVSFAKDNMFLRTAPNSLCLAVLSAEEGPAVLGNIAQVNFMVGYDTENNRISFKPTYCTKPAN